MSKVITQDNEQILQIYNRLKETLTLDLHPRITDKIEKINL